MQPVYIQEFAFVRTGKLFTWLSDVKGKNHVEALHQMRVEIKKVRSVLYFLQVIDFERKRNRRMEKGLRSVFREGGLIRDTQLKLKWMSEKRLYKLIRHFQLREKIKDAEAAFIARTDEWRKILLANTLPLPGFIQKISQENVFRYMLELKNKLNTNFHAGLTHEHWHEERKDIKRLIYGINWMSPGDQKTFMATGLFRQFDRLQDLIGLWHDREVLKMWLTAQQPFIAEQPLLFKEFGRGWDRLMEEMPAMERKIKQLLKKIEEYNQQNIVKTV